VEAEDVKEFGIKIINGEYSNGIPLGSNKTQRPALETTVMRAVSKVILHGILQA
jgi:hypothetical protein